MKEKKKGDKVKDLRKNGEKKPERKKNKADQKYKSKNKHKAAGLAGKAMKETAKRKKSSDRYELRMQMLLRLMKDEMYVPMKEKELAVLLQVGSKDRDELHKESGRLKGVFRSTRHGFGFVEAEGRNEEFFIHEDDIHGALHLDVVEIEPLRTGHGRRPEAVITQVLERATDIIVGTFEKTGMHY